MPVHWLAYKAKGKPPVIEMNEWFHYVVYDKPKDYPKDYVCRRWRVGLQAIPDSQPLMVGTLEECRSVIPASCVCLNRSTADDPVILETWI